MLRYSPKDIKISVAGLHTVTGFSTDTFVRISQPDPTFVTKRSMDGVTARLGRKTDRFLLELTLAQSSPSNDVLQTIFNIDRLTLKGKFPMLVKDLQGTSSFISATSWIEGTPDVEFSGGIGYRTWRIHCVQATMIVGGAGDPDSIMSVLSAGSALAGYLSDYGVI